MGDTPAAGSLQTRRKFLLASGNASLQSRFAARIDLQVDRAQIIYAEDGQAVIQKVENDPPHVLILADALPKKRGAEVVESLLYNGHENLSIILLAEIPERQMLVEKVASGQLQFLEPADIEEKFAACIARALNWLARGDSPEFTIKFLAAGEYLMRQGEVAESVYILRRGHMKAFVKSDVVGDKSATVVNHGILLGEIEPKEFVGEMAYISGNVRSADVIADTDCELIEIPIHHLDRLLFQKPAWAKSLMRTLSKRMKTANDQKLIV